MADLSTLNITLPTNTDPVGQGDDRIRETRDAIVTSFGLEHHLTGEHKFDFGNTASRPAAGKSGNIYIDTQANLVYYDNGSAWELMNVGRIYSITGLLNTLIGGAYNGITPQSIEVPLGGRVLITGTITIQNLSGGARNYGWKCDRDGTDIAINAPCHTVPNGQYATFPIILVNTPGAGTFAFTLAVFIDTTTLTSPVAVSAIAQVI